MDSYCELYTIWDGDFNHNIIETETKEDEELIDQKVYNDTFNYNKINVAAYYSTINNKKVITKLHAFLPPRLLEGDMESVRTVINRFLTIVNQNPQELFEATVLNFKNANTIYDYELYKVDELKNYLLTFDIFYKERIGRLSLKETNMLSLYRKFNFENILTGDYSKQVINNKNAGTIVISKDKTFEHAETQRFHLYTARSVLSRYYKDASYMGLEMDELVKRGNVIVSLSKITDSERQVIIYRPENLNAYQEHILRLIKEKVFLIKQAHPELNIFDGELTYNALSKDPVADNFLPEDTKVSVTQAR